MSAGGEQSPEIHKYIEMIKKSRSNGRDISFISNPEGAIEELAPRLMRSLFRKLEAMLDPIKQKDEVSSDGRLPNFIHFPYARHSSLPELQEFVKALQPRDITPCTFDADLWLQKRWTIEGLFGDCCSGDEFQYDALLEHRAEELFMWQKEAQDQNQDSQETASSASRRLNTASSQLDNAQLPATIEPAYNPPARSPERTQQEIITATQSSNPRKRDYDSIEDSVDFDGEVDLQGHSQASSIPDWAYATRQKAFDIASANIMGDSWETIGLISTTDNHTSVDEELGLL
jgi:hypothetical protein